MQQHRNGYTNWEPPSERSILLEIASRIGGLETGQRMTLEAVEHSFDRLGSLDRRVTNLEAGASHMSARITAADTARQQAPAPATSQPSTPISAVTTLLVSIKDLAPLVKALGELLLLAIVLALALKGAVSPEALLKLLTPSGT